MQISAETPRKERTIGGILVSVPQPYAAGQTIDAGEAAMLNQTFAENISNNMRARAEVEEGEGEQKQKRLLSAEEFQPLIDEYVAGYVPGVRTGGGGGGAKALTPIEKEMRNIATEKLKEILRQRGLKQKEVDFVELRDQIVRDHAEALKVQAEKIVRAREKAASGEGFDLSGLFSEPAADAA